jgi:hypothetical protein
LVSVPFVTDSISYETVVTVNGVCAIPDGTRDYSIGMVTIACRPNTGPKSEDTDPIGFRNMPTRTGTCSSRLVRFKIMKLTGCGLTITSVQIWRSAASPRNRSWLY